MGSQNSSLRGDAIVLEAAPQTSQAGLRISRPATLPIANIPRRIVLSDSSAVSDNPISNIPDSHFQRCAVQAPRLYNWSVNPEQLHGSYNVTDGSMYISVRLPVPIKNFPVIHKNTHVTIAYKAMFTSLQWYQYKNWARVLLSAHITTAVLTSTGQAFYLQSSEFLALVILLKDTIYKVGGSEVDGTSIAENGFHVTWNA